MSGLKKGNLKLAVQCKYGKRPNFKDAWVEANTDREKNEIPVGVVRFKGEKNTLVVLSWHDFERFLK